MSVANISIQENTGKASSMQVRLDTAATDVEIGALITAVKAVSLGLVKSAAKSVDVAGFTPDSGVAPVGAQRGQKFLVSGTGADGDSYTFTIPCADSSEIATAGSDVMDITTAASNGLALATAIEAVWGDEAGGAMSVDKIEYRNYTIQ